MLFSIYSVDIIFLSICFDSNNSKMHKNSQNLIFLKIVAFNIDIFSHLWGGKNHCKTNDYLVYLYHITQKSYK